MYSSKDRPLEFTDADNFYRTSFTFPRMKTEHKCITKHGRKTIDDGRRNHTSRRRAVVTELNFKESRLRGDRGARFFLYTLSARAELLIRDTKPLAANERFMNHDSFTCRRFVYWFFFQV